MFMSHYATEVCKCPIISVLPLIPAKSVIFVINNDESKYGNCN